jgi:hypothetical protein
MPLQRELNRELINNQNTLAKALHPPPEASLIGFSTSRVALQYLFPPKRSLIGGHVNSYKL